MSRPQPKVRSDSFVADVANMLLLRPVYRAPKVEPLTDRERKVHDLALRYYHTDGVHFDGWNLARQVLVMLDEDAAE